MNASPVPPELLREVAKAICRVQLNDGDPNQPAVRWNGTQCEPQDFPAWQDFRDEATAAITAYDDYARQVRVLEAETRERAERMTAQMTPAASPKAETDRAEAEGIVDDFIYAWGSFDGPKGPLVDALASALATARAEASARVRIVRQATLAAAREEGRGVLTRLGDCMGHVGRLETQLSTVEASLAESRAEIERLTVANKTLAGGGEF